VKFPDFFYIKQTRRLNTLHDFSVDRLASLHRRSNPQNAYDAEWGMAQLESLTNSILLSQLKPDSIARILRHKLQPSGFYQRPEMDRDTFRIETIQANIEQELVWLLVKKTNLFMFIQIGIWLAILAVLILSVSN
jgi:hypothetical protein